MMMCWALDRSENKVDDVWDRGDNWRDVIPAKPEPTT